MKRVLLVGFQIAALGFAILAGWGWLVLRVSDHPDLLPAQVSESIRWVAEFPDLAKRVIRNKDRFTAETTSTPDLSEVKIPDHSHHLLVTRLSEEFGKPTIRLLRLHDRVVIHEWIPDEDAICPAVTPRYSNCLYYIPDTLPRSVLLEPELSIVVNYHPGPLVRFDSLSRMEWVVPEPFHHSLEVDADGYYWSPLALLGSETANRLDIYDDALARVSPDGEIVFTRSVFDLFVDNDLIHYLIGAGHEKEPVHLNDIQPALDDGAFWKRDDLFVSARHASLVFLYRPSTDEVLWLKNGPWLNQHDVDILDSTRISVFGNNMLRDADAENGRFPWSLASNNEIYVYDFATDLMTTPYSKAMAEAAVMTKTEGISEIQPDNLVFVSETNYGRHLLLDSLSTRWEFVEKNQAGRPILTDWVRLLRYDEKTGFQE